MEELQNQIGTSNNKNGNSSFLKSKMAIGSLFIINGFIVACFSSRIPTIKENLNLTDAELGVLLLFPTAGSLLGLPIAAYCNSKLGSRLSASLSVILYCLALFGIPLISNFLYTAILLVLLGVFGNGLNISMNTQAIFYEKKTLKNALSNFHAIFSLGGIIGALISNVALFYSISISLHYLFSALVCIVLYFLIKDHLLLNSQNKKTKSFILTQNKILMYFGIIACCILLIEGSIGDWSGVYLKTYFPDKLKFMNFGYSAFFIMMAIGRLLGDKIRAFLSNYFLLITSMSISFISIIIITASNNFFFSVLGYGLLGLGLSCLIPTLYSIVGQFNNIEPSIGLAVVSTIGFIGQFAGPPMVGFASLLIGLKLALLSILISSILIAIFITLILKKNLNS